MKYWNICSLEVLNLENLKIKDDLIKFLFWFRELIVGIKDW